MGLENGQMKQYLLELYEQSQGESQSESSMYEIGAALGLEKSEAGALAEDLIIEGYAELKNLAGGITITAEGIHPDVVTSGFIRQSDDLCSTRQHVRIIRYFGDDMMLGWMGFLGHQTDWHHDQQRHNRRNHRIQTGQRFGNIVKQIQSQN